MRLRIVTTTIALMMTAFAAVQAFAEPTVFRAYEDERDEISFTSKATLEKIVGRVGKSHAEIMIENLADLTKGELSAVFEVDLNSIKTGIDLRDQHMRDNFLETKEYPTAVFALTKVI
ncbi:MAG: YceI family protein, partial [Candidatus Poribacteria bacterium]|nr:YceI family protein [Candidatus Poribacteria bacterium]